MELKKISSGKGIRKGEKSFPDFEFGMLIKEKEHLLNYEVDMGTETAMYVKEKKLKLNEGNMLFICKDERKIELIAYMCKLCSKEHILFSTLEDFYLTAFSTHTTGGYLFC